MNILLIVFLLSGCSSNASPIINYYDGFAIYMVKQNDGSGWPDFSDINCLPLEEKPILTDEDIEIYQWNPSMDQMTSGDYKDWNQIVSKDGVNLSERLNDAGYKGAGIFPFVTVVSGERIYAGYFWVQITSMSTPKGVCVSCMLPVDDDENTYVLADNSDKQLLRNKRIYDVMVKKEKLQE